MGKRKLQTYGRLPNIRSHLRPFRSPPDDMFFPSNPDLSQDPPNVPPRPKSQKEATMASEPTQEQIDIVTAFTEATREQAVRYLKVSGRAHVVSGRFRESRG